MGKTTWIKEAWIKETTFIYMPTIQHTGTWTLIDVIAPHPEIKGFVQLRNLPQALGGGVIRTHNIQGGCSKLQEELVLGELNLLHSHVGDKGLNTVHVLLAALYPTVMPLRDPLAVAISKRKRFASHPKAEEMKPGDTFYIELWEAVIDVWKRSSCFYVPLDTNCDKITLRNEMFAWLKLKPIGHAFRHCNSVGDSELARRYEAGDVDYLRKILVSEWASLRQAEEWLRPFLENVGYTNLLWWS